MDRALGNLLRRNWITYDEALKYAKKPEELNRYT